MNLFVKGHGLMLPKVLREYVQRRVRFVVGRFGSKVAHVTVRIADVNGPKGGADKLCRVEARLWGRLPLVAEDRAADLRQAVDRAVDRIGRVIGRAVARRRVTPGEPPVAPRRWRTRSEAMRNQIRTILLMGVLSALLIAVGGLLGQGAMALAVALAVAMNVGAYFFSDKIVLRMHRAEELGPEKAPGLHRMVEELAYAAGIPKPRLYLIPEAQPNAFATGRNPAHGVVAVTSGLLRLLSEREVRGVIAHEIAHIKNRDILVATVASAIAAAVGTLANILTFSAFFGGRSEDEEGGSALGGLLAVLVAPLAATLIQLGVSRSREYLADETGARIARDPEGLASALERLERTASLVPVEHAPATASLFIVNPLAGAGGLARLFSTHPPMQERVRRLRGMTGSHSYLRVA